MHLCGGLWWGSSDQGQIGLQKAQPMGVAGFKVRTQLFKATWLSICMVLCFNTSGKYVAARPYSVTVLLKYVEGSVIMVSWSSNLVSLSNTHRICS